MQILMPRMNKIELSTQELEAPAMLADELGVFGLGTQADAGKVEKSPRN